MFKLKNCPFCGSSNNYVRMLEDNWVCIECEDCGAQSGTTSSNYKGWQVAVNAACKKWNMRAKKEKYDKYGKIE